METSTTQRSLEAARQRYHRLVIALTAFQHDLNRTPEDALPPWPKLQSHFNLLAANLDSLTATLQQHFPPNAPQQLTSYPTPAFPPAQHQTVVPALLNKMLPEDIKASVQRALEAETDVTPLEKARRLEEEELWKAAHEIVIGHQEERRWDGELLTNEEQDAGVGIESLIGVRKVSEAGLVGAEKGASLEGLLRFMNTGVPIEKQPPLPTATLPGAGLKRS